MLIEKQAAAARLSSPSRLETFAANSPPRQRATKSSRQGGGRTANGCGRKRVTEHDKVIGGEDNASTPNWTSSTRGVPLTDLVSAISPPRTYGAKQRVGEGSNVRVDAPRRSDGRRGRIDTAKVCKSLARETYTKTFSGMQVRRL